MGKSKKDKFRRKKKKKKSSKKKNLDDALLVLETVDMSKIEGLTKSFD